MWGTSELSRLFSSSLDFSWWVTSKVLSVNQTSSSSPGQSGPQVPCLSPEYSTFPSTSVAHWSCKYQNVEVSIWWYSFFFYLKIIIEIRASVICHSWPYEGKHTELVRILSTKTLNISNQDTFHVCWFYLYILTRLSYNQESCCTASPNQELTLDLSSHFSSLSQQS